MSSPGASLFRRPEFALTVVVVVVVVVEVVVVLVVVVVPCNMIQQDCTPEIFKRTIMPAVSALIHYVIMSLY